MMFARVCSGCFGPENCWRESCSFCQWYGDMEGLLGWEEAEEVEVQSFLKWWSYASNIYRPKFVADTNLFRVHRYHKLETPVRNTSLHQAVSVSYLLGFRSSCLEVLVACAFSAAVEDFEVWEPVPFRGKQAWHPTVSQKISMETPVKRVEVEHSTLLAGCLVGVWITKEIVMPQSNLERNWENVELLNFQMGLTLARLRPSKDPCLSRNTGWCNLAWRRG